jgi:hypothetical protein
VNPGLAPMLDQPAAFNRALSGFLREALVAPFPFDRSSCGVH